MTDIEFLLRLRNSQQHIDIIWNILGIDIRLENVEPEVLTGIRDFFENIKPLAF